ncbi:hypothetical protein HG531_000446 [Fusarium graminearum]|nr:hypothetical protein HG531_000446 [Fusarium graminearum]
MRHATLLLIFSHVASHARTTFVAGYDRNTTSHGFQNNETKGFCDGTMKKNITTGIRGSQVLSNLEPCEDNLALLPQRIEQFLHFLLHVRVAIATHDIQLEVKPSSIKLLCCLGKKIETFLTSDAGNCHENNLPVWG